MKIFAQTATSSLLNPECDSEASKTQIETPTANAVSLIWFQPEGKHTGATNLPRQMCIVQLHILSNITSSPVYYLRRPGSTLAFVLSEFAIPAEK
jgi:hypothetical protein